ncbi:MAG: diaminopimelate epimerase [Burkholderiales bacterium]|nr:diaminopimelate epimerase [Burkholderiales bacterium]
MRLPFTKMQGAGNDFVVLDATRRPIELTPAQVRRLADRRFGVGADQVLQVEPGDAPGIDFRYRIYNASGDEVEHCGNGARCFLRYVHERGLTDRSVVRVATVNNVLELRLQADGQVTVDMNRPVFEAARIPFVGAGLAPRRPAEGDGFELWPIEGVELAVLSMGNPHAVQRVADVDAAPVATLGPRIETHARFPQQVNAGFVQVVSRGEVRLRVHERGAGETLACGTGACAAVVAGIRLGWLDRRVQVHTRGGTLAVEWPRDDAAVLMTGPAVTVFVGEIEL